MCRCSSTISCIPHTTLWHADLDKGNHSAGLWQEELATALDEDPCPFEAEEVLALMKIANVAAWLWRGWKTIFFIRKNTGTAILLRHVCKDLGFFCSLLKPKILPRQRCRAAQNAATRNFKTCTALWACAWAGPSCKDHGRRKLGILHMLSPAASPGSGRFGTGSVGGSPLLMAWEPVQWEKSAARRRSKRWMTWWHFRSKMWTPQNLLGSKSEILFKCQLESQESQEQ